MTKMPVEDKLTKEGHITDNYANDSNGHMTGKKKKC